MREMHQILRGGVTQRKGAQASREKRLADFVLKAGIPQSSYGESISKGISHENDSIFLKRFYNHLQRNPRQVDTKKESDLILPRFLSDSRGRG